MKKKLKYWAFFAFTVALAITFAVLKLTGVIAWSWFWVVSPVVIPFGLGVLVVLVALAFAWYYNNKLKSK